MKFASVFNKKWLNSAGFSEASFVVSADVYACEGGGDSNSQRTIDYLKSEAKRGNKDAQYELARKYEMGSGVERDEQKAADWYEKAAKQGHSAAQLLLGILFATAEKALYNPMAAVIWLREAQKNGQTTPRFFKPLVEEAAEQGHAESQMTMGSRALKKSKIGIRNEYTRKQEKIAADWFTKAALQGLKEAQFNIGLMTVIGQGREKNSDVGVSWLLKAADNGCVNAQRALGKIYLRDVYVKQDLERAKQWLVLAAEQGDQESKVLLLKLNI